MAPVNAGMKPSSVSGPSSQPLLGETIGACFERIAATHPDADALVSCHQSLRYT
jgi:fatty-acyl-CoA synthase